MKQVLIRRGEAVVEELPAPVCGDGEILVRTAWSLISAGTETATLRASAGDAGPAVWTRRARKAGEVLKRARARGIRDAVAATRARLEGESLATGYSLSGTVVEVGRGVADLVPGQAVACAGSASAHHAEIVAVPRHLAAPVPAGLPLDRAAFVTLGAIAMHGVRQADVRLGETVAVLGLGLLGQLTVSLLRASGCRVLGADPDPGRVERAVALGLELGVDARDDDAEARLTAATAARGADAVIVAAAAPSSETIRRAVRLVRRRGRIVVVGDVGMDLDRGPFYLKEAELRIACSYGPGRYDPDYEEGGLDYPFEYVRWTENRNMEEFLRLAAAAVIPVERLIDRVFALDDAADAYRALEAAEGRPLGILLRYPDAPAESGPSRRRPVVAVAPKGGAAGVALVGPGVFASAVHLPNLASLPDLAALRVVVARSGHAAREAARRWGAASAATALESVLGDPDVDALVICTRHDLHAAEASAALAAGKAVFLEKPAALDLESLDALSRAREASGRPFTVGFNRRFAPDVIALRRLLDGRRGPATFVYRVNAGSLPPGHWALGPEGGGRLVGEACHMIDLLRHLAGSPVARHAVVPVAPPPGRPDLPLGDNVAVTLRHADGSLSTLVYTSVGDPSAGKESLEAHWDGRTARIDDFRALEIAGAAPPVRREAPDKGHREILRRFLEHVLGRGAAPIPIEEIFETSRLAIVLEASCRGVAYGAAPA